MKIAKITFWITTGLIFLFEGVLTAITWNQPMSLDSITDFGYPVYFAGMLAFFKVLGAIVLIVPAFPRRVKEWAYAGFGIDFIAAIVSIYVTLGLDFLVLSPAILAMIILILSYISWMKISACMTNPVGWFEIPVTDMDRAKNFYEKLLNITLKRQDIPEYQMTWFPMQDGNGASGALMKGPGYDVGSQGPVIYFTCLDIEGTLVRVPSLGGKVILPKKSIGQYGYIGWLTDSEGNTVALHSRV